MILGHIRKVYGGSESFEYFYPDNLGSRRVVLNNAGTVTDKFTYSAYGEVTHVSGSNLYLASFTGKEYDATELIYFNARYYDPELGRFITEDPSAQGTSWYSYCGNNPINAVDPDGREINYNGETYSSGTTYSSSSSSSDDGSDDDNENALSLIRRTSFWDELTSFFVTPFADLGRLISGIAGDPDTAYGILLGLSPLDAAADVGEGVINIRQGRPVMAGINLGFAAIDIISPVAFGVLYRQGKKFILKPPYSTQGVFDLLRRKVDDLPASHTITHLRLNQTPASYGIGWRQISKGYSDNFDPMLAEKISLEAVNTQYGAFLFVSNGQHRIAGEMLKYGQEVPLGLQRYGIIVETGSWKRIAGDIGGGRQLVDQMNYAPWHYSGYLYEKMRKIY